MTKMTQNQKAILTKIGGADTVLFSRDFAEIATVSNGRWEWALPILRALSKRGFVETVGEKTHKGTGWKITQNGRQALKTATVPVPKAPGKMSIAMQNELVCTGKAQKRGGPYERCGQRTTHEALEARGLVTIEREHNAWRNIRLTEAGIKIYNQITGETLVIPDEYTGR